MYKMKPVSECLVLLYEKGYILSYGGMNFVKGDGIHSKYLQTYVLNSCGKEVEPIEGIAFLYDEIIPQGKALEGCLCGFSGMSLEDARENARQLVDIGVVKSYNMEKASLDTTRAWYEIKDCGVEVLYAYPVRKADLAPTLIID